MGNGFQAYLFPSYCGACGGSNAKCSPGRRGPDTDFHVSLGEVYILNPKPRRPDEGANPWRASREFSPNKGLFRALGIPEDYAGQSRRPNSVHGRVGYCPHPVTVYITLYFPTVTAGWQYLTLEFFLFLRSLHKCSIHQP